MNKSLIFATSNPHKLLEVQHMFGDRYKISSLESIPFQGEIPETRDTIEGNAMQKVEFIAAYTDQPVFAEDTGLIVPALGGAPGVHSARYAGDQKSDQDNIRKLLAELEAYPGQRQAYFKTVVAYRDSSGQISTFTGEVHGIITSQALGSGGFGYDPVFQPDGYDRTFGQLEAEIKNTISHRRRAMDQFVRFLSPSDS